MWLSLALYSISLAALCTAAVLAKQQSRVALTRVKVRHG